MGAGGRLGDGVTEWTRDHCSGVAGSGATGGWRMEGWRGGEKKKKKRKKSKLR